MMRRSADSIATVLVAGVGLALLGLAVMRSSGSIAPSNSTASSRSSDRSGAAVAQSAADAHLQHVETYLRFARDEVDCRDAFARARRHLQVAELALDDEPDRRRREALQHRVADLSLTIAAGEHNSSNYFHGAFPWSTFLASSTLPGDAPAAGTIELFDEPAKAAVRAAIARQILSFEAVDQSSPQIDFLIVGDPPDATLEFDATAAYARHELFRPYDPRRLSAARLTRADWSALRRLEPSNATIAKLTSGAADNKLMLVRIAPVDRVDGRHFYELTVRVYGDGESSLPPALIYSGICRDRRSAMPLIVGFHLWLLAMTVTVGVWFNARSDDLPAPAGWYAAPWFAGAFVCGRLLVWPVAKVLAGAIPDGRSSAFGGVWWTVAAGTAVVLGPALITWALASRLRLLESIRSTIKPTLLLTAVTAGASAYLCQNALILRGWEGWQTVVPVVLAALTSVYPLVRALDDERSWERWHLLPLLGLAALGPSFAFGRPWPLWATATGTASILATATVLARRSKARRSAERRVSTDCDASGDEAGSTAPNTIDELLRGTIDPPYQPTPVTRALLDELRPLGSRRSVSRVLLGRAGVGKSATIRAIEQALRREIPGIVVLQGTCPQAQQDGEAEPYQPFVEAIERHFRIHPLAPRHRQMARVQDTLGGIFAETIPFAGLLFPPDEPEPTIDKQQVFQSVADMLRNLAARQPVLLVIDDMHWIDAGSRELAEFLVKSFPDGGSLPIGLLFSGREDHSLFARLTRVTMTLPDPAVQRAILVNGLGLSGSVADSLIRALDGHRDALPGLLQIVAHLARQGHLEYRAGGFAWKSAGFRLEDHLPDDFRESLEVELAGRPEVRHALECAACIGPQFTVEQLSVGLELTRWQTLRLLDEIERTTHLVRDVRARDDEFEFCSSFLLEALRKMFDVSAAGPASSTAPQRIREFHYRLGCAAEQSLDASNAQLYAAANHFFAAGARHAARAYRLALRAAQTASAQFRGDLARRYVEMATECAAFCDGDDRELRRTLLLVECQAAHVEGTGRVDAATKASAYLAEHPESDFVVYQAAVRAIYDAGVDTHDQAHFRAAADLARRMVERFPEPLHQAEARQFWGISLPRGEALARREHLETALQLVESVEAVAPSAEATRLQSRIMNSLAEHLSYGTAADKLRAKRLFESSIERKSRAETYDAHGLALAHGGLGRLAFFAEPPDLTAAREHFLADLEYSRQVGSRTGRTRMHGLLAAVELRSVAALDGELRSDDPGARNGIERALAHFREARELADERWDKTMALAGLLQCHAALGEVDLARGYGMQLADLVQGAAPGVESLGVAAARSADAMPPHCRRAIAAALRQCSACEREAWHRMLGETG